MKKTVNKLLIFALAMSLALSGCGGGETQQKKDGSKDENKQSDKSTEKEAKSENEIRDLVISKLSSREMETFNILYAQRQEDSENLTNLVDGLVEADTKGGIVPAIAESWETTDGGVTWTFHLRDGVKWVDVNGNEKAECTAEDFATGLEWVLNFYKNDSYNTSMPNELIKGASEYYEYTKTLSEEEAKALTGEKGSKFREMVGLEVVDEHTLVYTCVAPKPYFYTVAAYNCLYPASQKQIDEIGVDAFKAVDNETMWYNGCYTMTSYIQGNEKVYTKNPMYWDKDCSLFDTVTMKMVESNDVAFQLYQSGEIDSVSLTESNLKTIHDNKDHPYYDYLVEMRPVKYSYQFHLNYDKKKEDGTPDKNWNTAAANEAFRKSWYYGLDLVEYFKRTNTINPLKCENNFYTMKGLTYTSDGRDYTDLVAEKLGLPETNGETPSRLDKEKAKQYKQQAIEELTALGVSFPVEIDHYIKASSQTALDSANVLAQCFADSLGEDYVKLNIKTYISSLTQEVRAPRLHSISMNGWGADYGDPQNYLWQEVYGEDNAIYSIEHSYINDVEETEATKELIEDYKTYTEMVKAADKICDDMDRRYEAYAEAEAFLLDNVLVLPCNYNVSWALSNINEYSKMNAMYGIQNDKMKNWETNKNGYTTEQMNEFAKMQG